MLFNSKKEMLKIAKEYDISLIKYAMTVNSKD